MAAISSSYVSLRFFNCSLSILACLSLRSKWHASSITSGSIFIEFAFSRSYSRACRCVMLVPNAGFWYSVIIRCQAWTPAGPGGATPIPCGATFMGPSGGNIGGRTAVAWSTCIGMMPVVPARAPALAAAAAGCLSSSSLIFSLISPASIILNFDPPSSPPLAASCAAVVNFCMSSLRCVSCSRTSGGTPPADFGIPSAAGAPNGPAGMGAA
mmetsp:Transcript_6597/g.18468  ORF Transcript_6597/g.18468 Transcript_6597/m.18468 type:complete len:212 (+) Transcript_6597:714-1349(+)